MYQRLTSLSFLCVCLCQSLATAHIAVGANFWNIAWEGQDDYIAKAYQGNWSSASNGNPWNAQFLSDISIYKCLRFMDWNSTNGIDGPVVWSDRVQKTSTKQQGSDGCCVAYEWQIDLCNRIKCDYWLNIPHTANQAYVTSLANFVKSNLDPNLKVWIEWSNETWNTSLGPQGAYTTALGDSVAALIGMTIDQWGGVTINTVWGNKSFLAHTFAACRVFTWFESAFGKNSPRVKKVLAGQAGWSDPCHFMLEAMTDSRVNPSGVKIDAFAIAPYWQAGNPGEAVTMVKNHYQWTSAKNLPLILYEGGEDGGRPPSAGAYNDYTTFLNGAEQYIDGSFCQYTHSGSGWGAKQKTSDANTKAASPKYAALVDWAAAHPYVPTSIAQPSRSAQSRPLLSQGMSADVKRYRIDGRSVRTNSSRSTSLPCVEIWESNGRVLPERVLVR